MQTEPRPPRLRSQLLRRFLILVLLGLPLGLAGGELALRGFLQATGKPYDGGLIQRKFKVLRSRLVDSIPRSASDQETAASDPENTKIIHPFVGFDDLVTMGQMEKDLRTRRELDPQTYRILILGGSVAGLVGRQGTRRLAKRLGQISQLKGRRIEFMTYARGGHKQPQQILRLVHLLSSGIRADAVINIDGFNEVAIGNYNRTRKAYPTYPSYNHWMRFMQALDENPEQRDRFALAMQDNRALIERIDRAMDRDLFGSAVWGSFTHGLVMSKHRALTTLRDEYIQILTEGEVTPGALGPAFSGQAPAAVEVCVQTWFESSRQIKQLCDLYAMEYLHVLQPTLHDPGAKPATKAELAQGGIEASWKRGVLLGYPAMRATGKQLASEGIHFLDASMIFSAVNEPLYYDNCHFVKKGVLMLADSIAESFQQLLGS